jgi:hypothetical protein
VLELPITSAAPSFWDDCDRFVIVEIGVLDACLSCDSIMLLAVFEAISACLTAPGPAPIKKVFQES